MIYQRTLYNTIKKQIKAKEIVVVTGMRRVGKTTLYRLIYDELKTDNKLFLDLENPLSQKTFEEKDYNNVIANLKELGLDFKSKAYIFLDEIQSMPVITRVVKYLYDHYDIKFFLTGSSSFYLKNLFPESLAGRKFVFELFPLDFGEFLVFNDVLPAKGKTFRQGVQNKNEIRYERRKKLYDEYIRYGGFPEVVLSDDREDKKLKLQDIFKSYFEKDVKILADFRELGAFRDLLLLLLQRSGSKIEVTKLSSEIGVSRETVYSYLSFLESTYFASFIRPFTRNVDREVSGARKVYVCDTGLLNEFARVTPGTLFENAVFLNLRKYGSLNYYEPRSGNEVDFIVDKRIAVEVKTRGSEGDFKKLKRTAQSLGVKQNYLITKAYNKASYAIPAIEI